MANLEKLLEALNESEVGDLLQAVVGDVECAEQSEDEATFKANVAEAIANAQLLISKLKELQVT